MSPATRADPADDPFGTADLRAVVLRTWASSPARFREDANAEESLALGYGGRVLAELAANGADAARAAGVPGEIAIAVVGRELRVANTGAPLTAAGVAALAALRASAKRDDGGVGHFGVGFTAVRALTDEPVVASTSGGIRFSAAATADAVSALHVDELDAELHRRQGQVPALRLPWPLPAAEAGSAGSDGGIPPGFVTEVRLPLRPEIDADALAGTLTVDTALDLLWALPDLTAVTVPGRRLERMPDPDGAVTTIELRVPRRAMARSQAHDSERERLAFRTVEAAGTVPPELLAGRPVEERARDRWRVCWILPVTTTESRAPRRAIARSGARDSDGSASRIGAPTPTDEPLGLPARLVGTFPVEESRSRIAPGPLTDLLVAAAADAYTDLVLAVPAADRLALIPPGGFPLGDLDAALRQAITDRLQRTAFLPAADGTPTRPDRACLVAGIAGPAAARIAEALPGLLGWPDRPEHLERLRGLGVRVLPVSAVTAALSGLQRPAEFWQVVYDGLADVPAEELSDLPVPRLAGGITVGPRGVLLPGALGVAAGPGDGPAPESADERAPDPRTPGDAGGDEVATAAAPGDHTAVGNGADAPAGTELADRTARLLTGLRLAALDHPLLRRLGAEIADAATILTSPALAGEIRRRLDDLEHADDPDPDDVTEFADLILDLLAAAGGAPDAADLAGVLLTSVDGEVWPAGTLLLPDAPLAQVLASDADLPVVDQRWVRARGPELLARLGVRAGFAVRRYAVPPGDDADLPDVELWWDEAGGARDPEAETFDAVPDLDLVADDAWPAALAMLAADRATRDAVRPSASGPSYTGWWLSRFARVQGRSLAEWRHADATDLAGLYDELPVTVPAGMASDLGVLGSLAQAAEDPAELLRRWADPDRPVPPGRVPGITRALVAALVEHGDVDLPDGVRTLAGTVVDAEQATVLDAPHLAQLLDPATLVAGGADPATVADVLDLGLASQQHRYRPVPSTGEQSLRLGAVPAADRCLALIGHADTGGSPGQEGHADLGGSPGQEGHADLGGSPVLAGGAGPPEPARAGEGGSDLADRAVLLVSDLAVAGDSGASRRVAWWVDGGRVLLDGSPEAVGRVVAFLAGCWPERHRLVAAARGDRVEQAEAGVE